MKKLLLAAVFMFALSQVSFASTSFADLLRQEKASSSFIPKIEVQTVTTDLLDVETTEEWTGYNLSEYISGPSTWYYDEDQTHAWRLENKDYSTSTEHFKYILSDEISQNDPGAVCQKKRVIIYKLEEVIHKNYFEDYSAAQCEANPPEEWRKYTCEESTKHVTYEDGERIMRTYKETDTCYEE